MPYIKPQKKKANNDGFVAAIVRRFPLLKSVVPKFLVRNRGPRFEEVCRDPDGTLNENLVAMQSGSFEKSRWMKLWLECTTKADKYEMGRDQFMLYFNLVDCIWVSRLFDIVNYGLTGTITFSEFFGFCRKYILADKASTIEFCFRMLSRRGQSFSTLYSCLDNEDIKHFLIFRYYGKGKRKFVLSKVKKIASNIVTSVTETNEVKDGTIFIGDFTWFCNQNPIFVQFTHHIQQHFRKCLFGMGFWVNKSRAYKYRLNGGMLSMTIPARSNMEIEAYCLNQLDDGIVDARGYPVKPVTGKRKPLRKPSSSAAPSLKTTPANSRPGTNQQGSRPGTVGSAFGTAMGGSEMDSPSRPTTGGGIEAGLSLATGGTLGTLSGGESSLLDAPKFLNATQLAEAQKKKRMLKYHEFLDLKAIPMNHGYNVELDFPEAELIRQQKKQARLLKKAGKTQEELVQILVEDDNQVDEEESVESEVGSIGEDDYERIMVEDENQRDDRDEHAYEDYVNKYLQWSHDPKNIMPIDRTRDLAGNLEAVCVYL